MAQISKQALLVENNQSFPNNNNGAITPSDLRAYNVDVIDSTVNQTQYTTDSGSWNQQIDALEAFTASQQPSFNALNSFTASQIVTNTALNAFTQSATQELDSLSAWTGSWEAWTSSINEIRDDGVLQGYSTRFFFNGLVSASIVQNVDGPIANVTIQQDGTKLNTASFNDYTASTAATQSVFSASVATSISQSSATFTAFSSSQNSINVTQSSFNTSATASIVQLLNFSSSLDAGFVSEAEFAQYTQSINSYTASTNARLNSIETITGSYATTGSNLFVGNQTITGSVIISSSAATDFTVAGTMVVTGSTAGARSTITSGSIRVDNSPFFSLINPGNGFFSGFGGTQLQQLALENDEGTIILAIDANGSYIRDFNPNTSDYSNAIKLQPFSNYGNGEVQILRNLQVTGSLILSSSAATELTVIGNSLFTGSLTTTGSVSITGSVYGNVSALSISSNTASIDLNRGNFFTLTLVSGSTTHLSASNIRPGQTINLLITQPSVGTGSVSYNSTFKFPAGANYVPTPITGSEDIVTLISYDTTKLYATSINNLG